MSAPHRGDGPAESLACWACSAALDLATLARDGFLKSRSERAGGPYVLATCPRCHRGLRCERNAAGRHFISPADDFGALDHLLRFFDADLHRRYLEEKAWRARREEERRRFFAEAGGAPPPSGAAARDGEGTSARAGAARERAAGGARTRSRRASYVVAPDSVRKALAVLGALPTDTWADVARAFRRQCQLCHPDRFALHDPAYRAVASRRFVALKEAYDLLRREWRPLLERE